MLESLRWIRFDRLHTDLLRQIGAALVEDLIDRCRTAASRYGAFIGHGRMRQNIVRAFLEPPFPTVQAMAAFDGRSRRRLQQEWREIFEDVPVDAPSLAQLLRAVLFLRALLAWADRSSGAVWKIARRLGVTDQTISNHFRRFARRGPRNLPPEDVSDVLVHIEKDVFGWLLG